MITFTEHNEIVMSVDDMRNIIRHAAARGWEGSVEYPQYPKTFIVESIVTVIEEGLRKGMALREEDISDTSNNN